VIPVLSVRMSVPVIVIAFIIVIMTAVFKFVNAHVHVWTSAIDKDVKLDDWSGTPSLPAAFSIPPMRTLLAQLANRTAKGGEG
jgi:hypothetical protein